MGKINREELYKILDQQYRDSKRILTQNMEINIKELDDWKGDVIDIKTEISMGNNLEGSLFRSICEDYYDKQKLLSSVPEGEDHYNEPISLDKLFWPHEYEPRTQTTPVTAPSNEQQFTKQELKQLLDMLVSLMLYMKHVESTRINEVKTIYSKTLELL